MFNSLPGTAQLAIKFDGLDKAWLPKIEGMFKEHARDQRHLIAELELANDALPVARTDAARIASNAPAPGE